MRALKIRTNRGMIVLDPQEAIDLRARLRMRAATRPASETIGVSANASTSVTLTNKEKAAVLEGLVEWSKEPTGQLTEGLLELQRALATDLA